MNATAMPPVPDAPALGAPAAALLERWFDLTRTVLPGMAAAEGWPIRLDHCFMRVCLDAAFGRPWHEAVKRPAARHMTADELARAVAVAERIAAVPSLLPGLNAESLRLRGKAGRGGRRRADAPTPLKPASRRAGQSPDEHQGGGEGGGGRCFVVAGSEEVSRVRLRQNLSTQGRNSISQVQALRSCSSTWR